MAIILIFYPPEMTELQTCACNACAWHDDIGSPTMGNLKSGGRIIERVGKLGSLVILFLPSFHHTLLEVLMYILYSMWTRASAYAFLALNLTTYSPWSQKALDDPVIYGIYNVRAQGAEPASHFHDHDICSVHTYGYYFC